MYGREGKKQVINLLGAVCFCISDSRSCAWEMMHLMDGHVNVGDDAFLWRSMWVKEVMGLMEQRVNVGCDAADGVVRAFQ